MGINKSEIRKVNITFNAATIPNSTSNADPVNAKTPNPIDVVKLAKNKVLPTVLALSIKDASLFCVIKYVSWYLFNRKMVLGTPMTTMSGGIRPESKVILNPNKTMVANDASMPISITTKPKRTTLMERKKYKRMREVTKMANPRNKTSSLVT